MAIPFIREFDFEYGRCDQLNPRVQRIIAPNPGPFTFTGTGVYIIGDDEVAVIDPGPDLPAHAEALNRALEGRRVTHVLVTHHHLDHTPLARPLAQRHGCKTYGFGPPTRLPDHTEIQMEEGVDLRFSPDQPIDDGHKFKGKDWTISALHTPGHTSNHMCFALKEDNALFCGDHIMGWSTSIVIPPDGHMGDYLAQLERIRDMGFDTLWPTHGPPIASPGPFIQAYLDHRHGRNRQVLDNLTANNYRVMDMVHAMYADVDPRLYPAAAYSVLAHLLYLMETGQVVCKGEPGLNAEYRLAG